jgi:amidase
VDDAPCDRSATELVGLLRTGQLSAREVLDAHLARIERTNPALNAIVTLLPDRARG